MTTVSRPEQPPARILIVDDASALRTILSTFFKSEGYHVVGELATGGGVLEAVELHKPNVVCLDYHLPDANGIDLLKAIHAAHPTVAVVMITGDTNPTLEADAAEAGAAGFIRKPFTQERMSREIRQVVHGQSLLQRHVAGNGEFAVNRPRARAVVVDDSATMRLLLTSILNQARIEVAGEAADGQQGVEVVVRLKPDIVCLDMDMPVMDGLAALEQIRSQVPAAKVLMITGRTGREAVMQAAKLGARGYILKPFEPDKVAAAIDGLLALN